MATINKTLVDSLQPQEKRFFVWDAGNGAVKGFGLVVHPGGNKTFVFQYRTPEGKARRYTIGKYGNVTPDDARKQARKLSAQVVGGIDPAGEKKERRQALTVSELLDAYLVSEKFKQKAPSTQGYDKGRIERHLKPLIGSEIADKLTPEKVRRTFANIRDGKTACDVKLGPRARAIVTGGEGAARMAIRLLRSVLSWAVKEGYVPTNVAMGVEIGSDGTRKAILTAEQYESLFRTLDRMELERTVRPQLADVIRVIALTGARRNEIASLKWRHVDLKRGVLVLPPSNHKTGKKTGDDREIGLPALAQTIIARQAQGGDDELVFTPAMGDGVISLSKPWRKIRVEAGLPEGIGLHGLRHSLATLMAIQGAQAAEIMSALGHKQLSTAQKYIHIGQDARSALMEKHTAGISAALEGRESAPVVELEPISKK